MLRAQSEMKSSVIENCHGGSGTLLARFVLGPDDSGVGVRYMHDDRLEPGAVIGEHPHTGDEEVYFVVEGHGVMTLDGAEHPIGPGDVSLVQSGHTHGIRNSTDGQMRLLVICVAA